MTLRRALAVLVACLVASPALAAQLVLSLEVDTLSAGQATGFSVTVTGGTPRSVPEVGAPVGLALAFSGQTQTTSIVQGKVERYIRYDYQLSAQAEGAYTLGPATAEVDIPGSGPQWLRSNAVQLTVGPAPAASASTPIRVENGFHVTEAWQGQVVIYHQALRSRLELQSGRWYQTPSDGLLAPRDGRPEQKEYYVQDEQGRILVSETWQPFVITDVGRLTFDAPVIEADIVDGQRGRSVFGFFRSTRREAVLGTPMTLDVKPLPEPPADFSGLVGDFTIKSRFDKETVKAGESVTWTVFLDGNGSPEGYKLPPAPDVDGARIYDAPARARSTMRRDTYRGGVTFERTIVATKEGTVEIPAVRLVVFSPAKGDYQTLEARGTTLRVTAGEGGDLAMQTFGPEAGIADVEPPPPETVHAAWSSGPAQRLPWLTWMPLFLGLAALPSIALAGGAALSALRTRIAEARSSEVRVATPRERMARLPAEPAARLAAMDAALRLALAHATGTQIARLDRDEALASLPGELGDQVAGVLRMLDRVRFAGAPEPAGLQAQVSAAIDALEAR